MQIFYYFCSVIKKFYILIVLCCLSLSAISEERWAYIQMQNELRIGWGDQLFESLMWHNPTSIATTMPTDWRRTYHEDYRHMQHLWIEYQWRFYEWLSFGAMMDGSGVDWFDVTRNGAGTEIDRSGRKYFYNLVFMPTVRFTYFFHEYVNIYSGVGLGLDINGGTELDAKGKNTAVGAALNITALGISANYDRWFMAVEFGGMTALQNMNVIYMAASRMISCSIGARF